MAEGDGVVAEEEGREQVALAPASVAPAGGRGRGWWGRFPFVIHWVRRYVRSGRRWQTSASSLRPPIALVLGFAALVAGGAALLTLPVSTRGGETDFLTALFTATSAVCVTGLVVVDTADHWSRFGQGVILLLMEFGGLGFIIGVTSLRLLLGQRMSLRQRMLLKETGSTTHLGG